MAEASDSSPGTQSATSKNGVWKLTTRKLPILKAEPIEELHQKIGIPIPEMIFGDNFVSITHLPTGWTLEFNASDALDRVNKTEEGMLQVAVAEEWKKERSHQEEVKQVVKPFDWSYSTDYRGTTHKDKLDESKDWEHTSREQNPIRTDRLSRPDPIFFFDAVDLYEDELADNGIASAKYQSAYDAGSAAASGALLLATGWRGGHDYETPGSTSNTPRRG